MSKSARRIILIVSLLGLVPLFSATSQAQVAEARKAETEKLISLSRRPTSTMDGPYEMVENWPTLLPGQEWGAAIGLIPDDTGGLWMLFRSEPPINYVNAEGQITKSFGEGMIVQAHGFCMDNDGNLWAGDSGPFSDDPSTAGRGFQIHKFSPDGEHLLSLGQAGVSRAGTETFIGPTACALMPDGNIVIADGHWPRPSNAQQDGDRLVVITSAGEFVREVGKMGAGPGEFMGPHALACDAQGRPSGLTILNDGTFVVADSESGSLLGGPSIAPEGGGRVARNPGSQVGIRIGQTNGSLQYYIPGTRPEGMAADNLGNIFAGLTGGCDVSPSGGCLQKWVRK